MNKSYHVLLLLLFTGCVTQEKCLRRFPFTPLSITTEVHDTTIFTRDSILVDTLSYIHMDTVIRDNKILLRPKLIGSNGIKILWLNDSIARITAHCKGDTIKLPAITKTKIITQMQEKVVNKIPLIYWVALALSVLILIILILR